MAFFATVALVFILIARPQEIWQWLNAFRMLDVFTGLAALGVAADFVRGRQRDAYTPQLPLLLAFVVSVYFSSVRALGSEGLAKGFTSILLALFMLVVIYGVRTLPRLRSFIVLLVGLSLAVSAVAVHQGLQPTQCVEPPTKEEEALTLSIGTPDGRPCEISSDCHTSGFLNVEYKCERVGLFNTISTGGGRVRWRGQLDDPNELSVFIGGVLPFIIALATWNKSRFATILATLAIALGLSAIVFTQSRGGQLVVAAVFASYFLSRLGSKGLIVAAVLVAPVMLFGGRSGESADESAAGRTEVLFHGVTMFAQNPIFGIGVDQFADAEGYTAHNAYLLAAVELGLVGFLCWTGLVWASVKIPFKILTASPEGLDPAIRTMAVALLVSMTGIGLGIFFLSFTFKQLLFIWLGMPGALYGIVREKHPSFAVRLGWRDGAGIFGFDVAIIAFLYLFTRLRA